MVEYSSETRFQLDLHVPEAALAAYLPPGWTPNVAAQGPAKDCNLRAIFVDRITINGPDGKPVGKGSNRLVYLAAPVKEPGGTNVQLDHRRAHGRSRGRARTLRKLSQRHNARDAAHHHQPAPPAAARFWTRRTGRLRRSRGEKLEMHIKYERGVANKGNPNDTTRLLGEEPVVLPDLGGRNRCSTSCGTPPRTRPTA